MPGGRGGRLPHYAPLDQPTYDPYGPLAGYSLGDSPWGDPVRSRLRDSTFPVLELCIDAYYVAHSNTFQGSVEFAHHWQAIQHFLREGADVQVCDNTTGGSCLHFAAGAGSEEVCKLLIRARARVGARDRKLKTPLWWAMLGNHTDVCRVLLEKDASVATTASLDKMSPLHEAAFLGHCDIVDLLLPHYRSLTNWEPALQAKCPGAPKQLDAWGHAGADVRGFELRTALHVAASQGHFEICQSLIEAAADPLRACGHGKTALHYAAESGSGPGCLELCNYLATCRPAARNARDVTGKTPLDLAARLAHLSPELKQVLQVQPRQPPGGPGKKLVKRRSPSSAGRVRTA